MTDEEYNEFEERFNKGQEEKYKKRTAELDENFPLQERIMAVAKMKAKEKLDKEIAEFEEYESKEILTGKIKWPAPIDKSALHGIVGEFVKELEPHTEVDPVAILISFLITFGSVVGDRPYFQVEATKHRMRIFGVLVGETSKARKGTSWDYIKNIFESIDPNWERNIQGGGLSSGEGLIWAVRNEIVKKQPIKEKGQITGYQEVIEDEGVKDKRLLIIEAEFASTLKVIGREGNTLSPTIRNAWDKGDLQTLTKNNLAKATGAHISIIGHITQDELLRYLTSTETGNGFGNRFLWCCVKRSRELAHGGNIQSVNFSQLVNRLRDIVLFAKEVDQIKWDEETYLVWPKIYHYLSEGKPGLIGALTARSEAYVCRLAGIYALLDKSKQIKVEHLKAAVAIWDYVEASIRYIFQGRTGDFIGNKIIEALREHPEGLTRTDLSGIFNRNIDSDQLSISIDNLLNQQRIKSESIQTEGRSKELFSLNSSNSYFKPLKTYLEILKMYLVEDDNQQDNEKNEISEKQFLNDQPSADEELIKNAEEIFGAKVEQTSFLGGNQ